MRSRLIAKRPRMSASVSRVIMNTGSPRGAAASRTKTAARTIRPRISGFLAQQAARPDDEDREHDEVHERERRLGIVIVAEHLHEGDDQRAQQRAEKAAHPADDD